MFCYLAVDRGTTTRTYELPHKIHARHDIDPLKPIPYKHSNIFGCGSGSSSRNSGSNGSSGSSGSRGSNGSNGSSAAAQQRQQRSNGSSAATAAAQQRSSAAATAAVAGVATAAAAAAAEAAEAAAAAATAAVTKGVAAESVTITFHENVIISIITLMNLCSQGTACTWTVNSTHQTEIRRMINALVNTTKVQDFSLKQTGVHMQHRCFLAVIAEKTMWI